MKKADGILIAVLLLIAAGIFFFGGTLFSKEGAKVRITVGSKVYGTYPLSKDREVVIETENGTDTLKIENGKAYMKQADCKDHYCMNQKAVSYDGETIVCLPLKIVVEVVADEQSKWDAVTK